MGQLRKSDRALGPGLRPFGLGNGMEIGCLQVGLGGIRAHAKQLPLCGELRRLGAHDSVQSPSVHADTSCISPLGCPVGPGMIASVPCGGARARCFLPKETTACRCRRATPAVLQDDGRRLNRRAALRHRRECTKRLLKQPPMCGTGKVPGHRGKGAHTVGERAWRTLGVVP